MPAKSKNKNEDPSGLDRILFFSDAVMAIAITLLAIDLKVPAIDPASAATELPGQLAAMRPNLIAFLISFMVIGIYWILHHRQFGYIKRYDTPLMLLNLVYLFFIASMPFLAGMLGYYVFVPIALIAYTLAISALGFSMAAIWWYATYRHRLVSVDLDEDLIWDHKLRLLAGPLLFLVAIPFAYVSSTAVAVVWWLVPASIVLLLRLFGRQSRK
jgi:uncharacterized membrane protein